MAEFDLPWAASTRDQLLAAVVVIALTPAIPGGTGTAWVRPPLAALPAGTGRQLVIQGTFVADGGRLRRLGVRARALGFADLRGYLQARCDAGWSVAAMTEELGESDWHVDRALTLVGVRVASAAERRARTRMRASEQRLAARIQELGLRWHSSSRPAGVSLALGWGTGPLGWCGGWHRTPHPEVPSPVNNPRGQYT